MVELERTAGQTLQIGPYTLRVLEVRADEVVVALLDPDRDCDGCGGPLECALCPVCESVTAACPVCSPSGRCRHGHSPLPDVDHGPDGHPDEEK
jgi:hypothetical protein